MVTTKKIHKRQWEKLRSILLQKKKREIDDYQKRRQQESKRDNILTRQGTILKMTKARCFLTVIILNRNKLSLIKKDRVAEWIKKQYPTICCV